MVPANSALRLRAILDYETDDGTKFVAGDEWLFEGPGKYCVLLYCALTFSHSLIVLLTVACIATVHSVIDNLTYHKSIFIAQPLPCVGCWLTVLVL